jgi:hypothetical protein
MTALLAALRSGISAKKILEFLMRKSPEFAPKISKALASGITAEKVLGFFTKGQNFEKLKAVMENEYSMENNANPLVQAQNVRDRNLANDPASSLKRSAPGILGAIGSAGLGMALNHALPNQLKDSIPETLQKNQEIPQQPPVNPVPPTAPQVQPVSSTLPQGNAIVQPQGISNISDVLSKYPGFIQKVQDLRNSGNNAISISSYFKKFNAGQSAKLVKEAGQPLEKIVEDYISKTPIQSSVKPLDNAGKSLADIAKFKVGDIIGTRHGTATISQLNDKTFELKYENGGVRSGPIDSFKHELASAKQEEKQPIAKADTVLTPDGLGEVVANRNGKSIVEVDGKKHQIEDKKILKPPKEAAVEALELIKSFTPEQQRSTHHMLNSYDEEEKKGFFVFHNGSAYVVDDISPEEYKELSEEIEQAKTTGETVIGKWASGEGSRGAGYNKIVKGVKDRKVVPELKKKFRKLKVGYNLLAEWQKLLGEHEKDLRSQRNQASE